MKYIFTLSFVLLHFFSFAQDAPEEEAMIQEVGLNATAFVNNFLNFGSEDIAVSNYHLAYKSLNENGKGFRMGVGLNINSTDGVPNSTTQFFTDEQKTTDIGVNLRFGTEKQRKVAKRWYLNTGFDAVIGYDYFKLTVPSQSSSDDFELETTETLAGLGPIIGIQVMLSERVGMYTEATSYLTYTWGKTKDNGFNNNDDETSNTAIGLNFTLPTNLFFFMRF